MPLPCGTVFLKRQCVPSAGRFMSEFYRFQKLSEFYRFQKRPQHREICFLILPQPGTTWNQRQYDHFAERIRSKSTSRKWNVCILKITHFWIIRKYRVEKFVGEKHIVCSVLTWRQTKLWRLQSRMSMNL